MPQTPPVPTHAWRWAALPCAAAVALLLPGTALAAQPGDAAPQAEAQLGPGDDAERSAALVAAEDRRLTEVRTVTSLARWQGQAYDTPFRMSTAGGYTLVLTGRSAPYTLADMLQLAPQTFLRLSDGSYLLSENVVVSAGATLRLSDPGGLTVRLASSGKGFVSLVSLGGKLELAGETSAPVVVTSWDLDEGAVDVNTSDGRAYVRALGGQFDASHLQASALGFWSGRTGGISLTGTDRPNTGAIEPVGKADPSVPSVLKDVTTQPAGPLEAGQQPLGYSVPTQDYVSSRITDSSLDGNAFGLFVSGANGIQISGSTVRNSLIDGVVLHRFVSNGVITATTSSDNAGDGFSLDRATTGISLSDVTASNNTDSGISLSGRPLAEGPSATGATTTSFGGNSVSNSTADGNGQFGIHVLGGVNIGVQNNRLTGNDMGIVVTGPAERVSVTGNEVNKTVRHGIAFTGGVTASTVTGNVVDGASTGIYLRDSAGQVKGNTVQEATSHGVSLVGTVGGSDVGFNVLAGNGASAMDSGRSTGDVVLAENQTDGWHDTSPWYEWFKKLLQPMNALWAIIAFLTLLSAIRSRGRASTVVHPYAHQMAHQGTLALPARQATEPAPDVVDLTAHERQTVGTP